MTFDLYNSQTPQSPDCRTSKKMLRRHWGFRKK